jgi:hypothetical protein
MPSDPNYPSWNTPVSSDPNNPPLHLQALMNAIGVTFKAHENATTAHGRNNAGPNPSQSINSTAAFIDNNVDYSATAVESGSPLTVVGFVFTAPASGLVQIYVSGLIEAWVGGNSVYLSYELRQGGTLGSGSVIRTPHADRALVASGVTAVGVPSRLGGSHGPFDEGGLTPGSQYNVRAMHIVSPAGRGQIQNRRINVVPWLR